MKVKKELIDSLFGKKQGYVLNYDSEQELVNSIYALVAEFAKQWFYVELHKNDKNNIALLNDARVIEKGNYLLFEYKSNTFLEKIINSENIIKTRDMSIYFFDKAIHAVDEKTIKEVLIDAPFEIVLGNYLETTKFAVDTKSYGSDLSEIIQRIKKL